MINEQDKVNQEPEDQLDPIQETTPVEETETTNAELTEEIQDEVEPMVEAETEVEAVTEVEPDVKAGVETEGKAEVEPEKVPEPVQEKPAEPVEEVVKPKPVYKETPQAPLTPPDDFDWNATGKMEQAYSPDERRKLEDLYNKTFSTIAEHEVVEGTISGITDREIVVNIGFKSDGVIPKGELRYNPDAKVGDKIEVYVESQEDQTGQLLLSHKKARILKSWERVNQAFETEEVIKGYVKSRTKGGLIVDVFGIEAFLPGSQIDVKPIRDYDIYVDKVMEFKVVKINHEYKNVVVSHKALIERELEQQKAEIISRLEKGQVLEGTVKNITTYGVFIDLGGVDGLIHITDLSWGRINHPEEIVELDQKIKVVILDFDDSKKRIALGLKQLTPHPWDALDESLKVGDKVKGKVVVIADYGAFVEIHAGVEGLLHVSEMSWSQHLRTAQDFLKVGDEVEAVVLTLDREERKMSLGMKQLIPDPWENIKGRYPVASKHTASVRNFTNFGIFVELEEGVDGLIHISDLSWSKKIKHPAEFTKVGEQIEVIVLDVDEENRRLSLGHKQLEENPWDVFESVFTVGSIHKGTISVPTDKGMIVTMPYGVEGFAPTRHLQKENGAYATTDETLDFKVIEFSKENKKIILSHARVYQDLQQAEKAKEDKEQQKVQRTTKSAVKKIKDTLEVTTFGDIGGLAELKSEMEQEAREKLEEYAKKQEKKESKKAKDHEKEEIAEEPVEDVAEIAEPEETVEVAEVKADEAIAVEPKTEEAIAEEPKTEEAIVEEPKAEEAIAVEPKAEEIVVDEPKIEEVVVEEPKTKVAEAKVTEVKKEVPETNELPFGDEDDSEKA